MSNVTAKQLSEVIGVSTDKLLEQLREAGVEVSNENDPISDDDKMKLLDSLRANHGKDSSGGPKKITLRRKSKTELRVSGSTGRNPTSRSINVEVRKKRTYVRRSEVGRGTRAPGSADRQTKGGRGSRAQGSRGKGRA
jgi:translation initiation factor IF-2